ncbi:hybrid sensor histidine kinase/response regulator [Roseofilum sp. BLCC_M143]|uniref:Chemotaxis protein CheA n=1 Tax=Roseofilum casamattae BLCC-M143 TaxID=3022442 RepID=A0ABT7BYC6_9CYAN|nr:hybrid sensor histidine kinase/response regulator [Roseofilum casamattae]MDJ1184198.1 hybrid sensor histidine kinase/response regulator [Roseofilum casamattae BLCC-M143]
MIIEDEELRQLYKISGAEHLQHLEAGILHLEQHPQDAEMLRETLREAHTLKGDSRMLGVKDVETLAHQIEQVLSQLKEDSTALQGGASDRLYYGLDAMAKLVRAAVTGEPSGVETYKVLATLMGGPIPDTAPEAVSESLPDALETVVAMDDPPRDRENEDELSESGEPDSASEAIALSPAGDRASEIVVATHSPALIERRNNEGDRSSQTGHETPEYRIESVRVATHHLDELMTQAGELTVSKIRMVHHISTIEDMTNLWEEWNRQTYSPINFTENSDTLYAIKQRHEEYLEEFGQLLHQLRSRASEDVARLETIADRLDEGIRTLRLLPLSNIFLFFPRLVRDLSKQQGKQVNLVISGGETPADKRILEEMKDPLMHMLRNSIDHGIETPEERIAQGKPAMATIQLKGSQMGNTIAIELSDDGRGLDLQQIKDSAKAKGVRRQDELDAMTPEQAYGLIFAPGFSTRQSVTEVSGRGVGLDVVRTNVEKLKGTIRVESTPGVGCKFIIQLSTSLATVSVLLVRVGEFAYAIPVEFVKTTISIAEDELFAIEGRETYAFEDMPISIARLANLLELSPTKETELTDISPEHSHPSNNLPCAVLQVGSDYLGVVVDEFIDQQDIILKPQSKILEKVRNIAGATILGTGEVCMVLDPRDLLESARNAIAPLPLPVAEEERQDENSLPKKRGTILLAEDSIATRTQEKRILESSGYEVITAVDGLDAYSKLRTRHFDGVVSDVEMPNLDGLSLAAKIREHAEYDDMPIILVTSLASDEDKRRGAEAGANAYLTKGGFSQELLLETVRRLV